MLSLFQSVLAPAALALWRVLGEKCAARIFHPTLSIPYAAALAFCVWCGKCAAHFSHYTLSIPYAAALAFWSVWCGKCALRAFFHTIHSLSFTWRARLLCIV